MKTKQKEKNSVAKIYAVHNASSDMFAIGNGTKSSNDFWRWGDDNLFPAALSLMARRSPAHRRIINDKADYISGKGFSWDETVPLLNALVGSINSDGESLRALLNKLAFDKSLFGNAFVEIVTDEHHSTLAMWHHDASTCRVGRDNAHIIMHHDWSAYTASQAMTLPLYPTFERGADGMMHSMIHYKDYEPMFSHYGVPPYIAGLNVSAIAYKTDRWNISRLDNSFQLSGVMLIDGTVDSEAQGERMMTEAQKRFAGNPGQVMFMLKECEEGDNTRFIPIASDNDGDWVQLHDQSVGDIVVAHSWFRSLSGLDYSSGFNSERILHEYEVALNTVILAEQEELLEPIKRVMTTLTAQDCSSLQVVNRPPRATKPVYMRVWEARRSDGLDYDPQDPSQQVFLSQIAN